jgi:hypothetical protein
MAFQITILSNGMAQLTDTENGDVVRYSLFEGHTVLGHWSGNDRPEYRTAIAEYCGGGERMTETLDGRPSRGHDGLIAERTLAHEKFPSQ